MPDNKPKISDVLKPWLTEMLDEEAERKKHEATLDVPPEKSILIVVATPKTKEVYMETEEFDSIKKQILLNPSRNIEFDIVGSNTDGLSKVYNKYIDEKYRDYTVLFIHDDVVLGDVNMIPKLYDAHEKANIVGVAGAMKIQLPLSSRKNKNCAWHMMCVDENTQPLRRDASGFVSHQRDDGTIFTTSFGDSNKYCRLIDGLFMSFDIDSCLDARFVFDERFRFHHYDLGACMNANMAGLRIYTSPIHITHKSLGESMHSVEWNESNNLFYKIYKNFKG